MLFSTEYLMCSLKFVIWCGRGGFLWRNCKSCIIGIQWVIRHNLPRALHLKIMNSPQCKGAYAIHNTIQPTVPMLKYFVYFNLQEAWVTGRLNANPFWESLDATAITVIVLQFGDKTMCVMSRLYFYSEHRLFNHMINTQKYSLQL